MGFITWMGFESLPGKTLGNKGSVNWRDLYKARRDGKGLLVSRVGLALRKGFESLSQENFWKIDL